MSAINALVIGVGYFGRHHARILSELNTGRPASLPAIDRLIVTRTRLESARTAAAALEHSDACSVNSVVGAEVANTRQLIAVLEKYQPEFTSITARDKEQGDSIHADYTLRALKYGAVLCEKPFSHAGGDGSSLGYFKQLQACNNAPLFGLDLPLAVVCRDMLKNRQLKKTMMQADRMAFYWEAWDRGEDNIIDDLVLHPWSLIPDAFTVEVQQVDDRGSGADLTLRLYNRKAQKRLPCRIALRVGAGFRGMQIDDVAIGFKSEATAIRLINLNQPLKRAAARGIENLNGPVVLTVDNPLKQHIVAALRHRPITGLGRTQQSQLFLESLRGYKA